MYFEKRLTLSLDKVKLFSLRVSLPASEYIPCFPSSRQCGISFFLKLATTGFIFVFVFVYIYTVKFVLWCTVLRPFFICVFFPWDHAASGILVPWPVIEPAPPCIGSIWDLSSLTGNWTRTSLHWKRGVLTTGLPGKSFVSFDRCVESCSHHNDQDT